jgi:signal transduction histidine kinase
VALRANAIACPAEGSKVESARFSSRHFILRLAAGVLLLLLLVITLAGLALYHSKHQYEERAAIATQNLAQLLAHDVGHGFENIDLALLSCRDEAERELAAGGIDYTLLDAYLARQLARVPNMSALHVSDADGNLFPAPGDQRFNVADRGYFLRLRDESNPGLVISEPLIGRIQNTWVIMLGRRLEKPDGRFAGAVLATVRLEHFARLFSRLDVGPHGEILLLGRDFATLAQYPVPENVFPAGHEPIVRAVLRDQVRTSPVAGTGFAIGEDGRRRVLSYHRMNAYPMYIVVGICPDDFLMEWQQEAGRTLTLTFLFLLVTAVFLLLIHKAWKRREVDAQRLADLSRRVVAVQESERRQLALELHDVVSPNLAALRLHFDSMVEELSPAAREKCSTRLSDIEAILDDTKFSLREICSNLRPAMLDYSGLLPALKDYAAQFSRADAAAVQVKATEPIQRAAPDVESLLFRIAQEAVTNCVKHAQAKNVIIELAQEGERTRLSIADDGVGFDPYQLGSDGHRPGLGLITMRERAEFAGGRFQVESHPGKGTRISVEI